jgi:starch synthase
MNILFVASEASPYYRAGGVADVVYGLAKELCIQGHDVRIAVPRYRTMAQSAPAIPLLNGLEIHLGVGAYSRSAGLIKLKVENKPTFYFVDQDFYFGRDDFYGYMDDYERFIFFTRFTLEMLISPEFRTVEKDWFPQIIQGFDWASGFIPGWLPKYRTLDSRFEDVRFSLFIHNIRRLGIFSSRALSLAEQDILGIYKQVGEEPDQINFLGRGLLNADQIVTVDPDFSRKENPLPKMAEKLRKVLRERLENGSLHGIPSRIDGEDFDPATDKALKQPFTSARIDQHSVNKLALQAELGFKQDNNIPLLGMVSRLIPENGIKLLTAIEKNRADLGEIQFVILAEPGDMDYQGAVQKWEDSQDQNSPWIKTRFAFDDNLARMIYAGCDIYLLPVRELPSGIIQLIAMHYGAVPVAHHTGAICKTILNYQPGMKLREYIGKGMGVGFKFEEYLDIAFLKALKTALQVYRGDPNAWRELQLFNMRERFTWDMPAGDYVELYTQMLRLPPRKIQNGEPLALNKEARLLQALQEIGNLPGMGKRSSSDILKQAARLVRWVLPCDAVYVRGFEEPSLGSAATIKPRKPSILERSVDYSQRQQPPDENLIVNLLNQSTNNTWKQLGDVDREGICQAISGLRNSNIARNEGWKNGWSVPLLAHGRLMGWIDALFTQSPTDKSWIVSSLTSLANSFGLRLDTIRIAEENDRISTMSLELIETQSAKDVYKRTSSWVDKIMPGSRSWVYPVKNGKLDPSGGGPKDIGQALRLAERALESQKVVYVADWNDAPRGEDHRRIYRSVLAIPIMATPALQPADVDSILLVVSDKQSAFTRDDEQILSRHLSPHIYAALQKAHWVETQDSRRVTQLKKLVDSLVAGVDFDELLQKVVDTIADVLEVRASALYLLEENTQELKIRAANGYQETFLDKKVTYKIGEGLTGWIAQHGEIVKANSLEDLHDHPGWKGDFNKLYHVPEPNAFLGIPLIIREPRGAQKVIGVLKGEDRKETCPKTVFDEEDVNLGVMMANVIATMVYNAQKSEQRLRDFSASLRELSDVLGGSRDMPTLMDNIVKKIAEVLHADASSLYLADENNTELIIQAAAGYQEPLVDAKVKYRWGDRVTGRIAADKQAIVANSLERLREIGGNVASGAFDHMHIEHLQPQSFYGLPLIVKEEKGLERVIGVLKVESIHKDFFSSESVLLIGMMANVIATVVYNAQQGEKRLRDFSASLRELSDVMVGSYDMPTLMDNIVKKIAEVLGADASSLYLANEYNTELTIQAAAGYQEPLVAARVKYKWGDRVTGRIAADKKAIVANSLEKLREIGGNVPSGAYDHLHKEHLQPQSFYGLPLIVREETGVERVIGVLKVESIHKDFFSSESVLLVEMMANVIATVVYNAQQGEERLRDFSASLRALSDVLVGSRDMPTLMDNIVKKIAEVLRADASSLYLADEYNTELTIQAAAGYQEPLVAAKAKYRWGDRVTGRIAADKSAIVANSLQRLREIGGNVTSGAFDHMHIEHLQPQSFYGLPLIVKEETGAERVIGVLKVESIIKNFFSSESVLLIEMMANVIATVVYNAQQGEKRIGSILKQLGSLSSPPDKKAVPGLLRDLACTQDAGILNQFGAAIATVLDRQPSKAEVEAKALFNAHANPIIYGQIAKLSSSEHVRWIFSLIQNILNMPSRFQEWEQVLEVAEPWLRLKRSAGDPSAFGDAAHHLVTQIAQVLRVPTRGRGVDNNQNFFGTVIDTTAIFGKTVENLPLIFLRQGNLDDINNQNWLRSFVQNGLGQSYSIAVFIPWNITIPPEQQQYLQERLREQKVSIAFAQVKDVLDVLASPDPAVIFRGLVLRQVPLTTPFVITGPVPDALFFGRVQEMQNITQYLGLQRSCALIGGRRIGKTSVLQRLHRVYLPQRGFRSIFHDCSITPNYEAFLAGSITDWRPEAQPGFPSTFGELFDNPPTDKALVLLLDEADKLIPAEQDMEWPLFNRLRALANTGRVQFLLCGEQALRQALHTSIGPLFNSPNEIILGPLEFHDVQMLITDPMKSLEIELVGKKEIINRIFEVSAGHPNIVQRLCARLTEQRQRLHRITLTDVEQVIEDPRFQRDDFLDTYWAGSLALEKIISLLMVQDEALRSAREIRKKIESQLDLKVRAKEVEQALENLVILRSILKLTSRGYEFAVRAFPKVVANAITLDDRLDSLKEEYQEGE